ncbi:MAG: AMP-dependent synthetase/ligase [Spirochaetaceae bacterium]
MEKKLDTIPKRIRHVAGLHPDNTALMSKDENGDFEDTSFHELYRLVGEFGCGLHALDIKRNDHVGIIADNRKEWIITDLALLGLGAVDVPRGSDSTAEEIGFILRHADCSVTFAENAQQAEKILSKKDELPKLKRIILFDGSKEVDKKAAEGVEILLFADVQKRGAEFCSEHGDFFDGEVEKGTEDDLATIIYTSGTTGEPKGVMLKHRSFVFQIERIYDHIQIQAGHKLLSVLPVWHSFERAVEYIVLNIGASLVYSKPIGSVMLPDMQKVKPQWLSSVPRIWEGVRAAIFQNMKKERPLKRGLFNFFVATGELYATFFNMFTGRLPEYSRRSKIFDKTVSIIPLILLSPLKLLGGALVFGKLKAKLGGRFIAGISGGGALPPYVDRFFQAAGIQLLEGYGLTETGPVLSVRKQKHPVIGTVGPLLPDIEYRVVDNEGVILPHGKKGTLFVKSPQVMEGYYKRPDLTGEVLNDGWLNTGDICVFTVREEFRILGRSKETIVLLGGENIEPVPIEDKLNASEAILQSMVVGQDQKFLAALIVPEMDKLEEYALLNSIDHVTKEELLTNPEIEEYIHNEIQSLVNTKNGFKHFECIYRFTLLSSPFEVGKELTHTMKIRRDKVHHLYHREIERMFKN